MPHYLIKFRFQGKAKGEIKKLIYRVDHKFRLRNTKRHRPVPHISLVGPFSTTDEQKLISDFKKLCSKQSIMEFDISGYGTFGGNRVVYINIVPDSNLDNFRWELSKRLESYCSLKSIDLNREFYYHATIAMKIPPSKFNRVKDYVQKQEKMDRKHCLIRVTLLKNKKILREYDFFLNRLLTRAEAKNRDVLSETFTKLEEYLSARQPIAQRPVSSSSRIFLTSDLHLGHKNIIKYCKRPFSSIKEMNSTLVDNWNRVVGKEDTVYFLGDMSFGKGSRSADYWLQKLNGRVVFIGGNHDRSRRVEVLKHKVLEYKGKKFYLVHDPKNTPPKWNGWVIHGHHHNKHPDEYPFINSKTRTINVSVELTDYKPVPIDELFDLDFENVGVMAERGKDTLLNQIKKKFAHFLGKIKI